MNKIKKEKKSNNQNPFIKALEFDFFSKEDIRKWLPFILYCTALAFVYISNRIHAEKKVRELNKLQTETIDKQADYLTIKSELVNLTKASSVEKRVKPLGLKMPNKPPLIINRNDEEQ